MYSLFIDTHSKKINVVLYKDGIVMDYKFQHTSKSHSTYIFPLLISLIEGNNITKDMIDEIIVVNGPGSFTGIRIGVTIAKTWAVLKECKIKQISSLEVLAASIKTKDNKVVGIADAKGYYIGTFNYKNEIIDDFKYLPNTEVNKESMYLEDDIKVDYNSLYLYANKLEYQNPHNINPIYIKKIGVEND